MVEIRLSEVEGGFVVKGQECVAELVVGKGAQAAADALDEMVEMEVTDQVAGALQDLAFHALGVVVETEAGILSEEDVAFARKLLDSYGPLT